MKNPISLNVDGHVENSNDTKEISFEEFKKISKGDVVFFGENEKGIVANTLTRSVYLEGARKQIYPSDLIKPFFMKKAPIKETLQQATPPTEQKQATVKKPVKAPVNPMMQKLESLLVRFPEFKAFILDRGASGTTTPDEIEGEILMILASESI